jgi:hypothetical protein
MINRILVGIFWFVIVIAWVTILMCGVSQAHETCFYKHMKYGPVYGHIKTEMGERLIIVEKFNPKDEYVLVQGFIMVHEFPDGNPGNKKITVHGSPMFYVTQANAWEEFQLLKSMWYKACEGGN